MPSKKPTRRGAKASRSSFSGKPKSSKPKPKAKPKAKPKLKVHAKRPAVAKKSTRPVVEATVALGELRVPSGQLAIFDIGLVGYLPRPTLAPMIVEARVPSDRPLPVTGTRVGRGRFADCWDHVTVVLGDGLVVTSKKLGEAAIDFGRVMLMDLAALDHWQHEDSLDGLADVALSGRDAAKLAAILPRHGWSNLPLADAEAKADLAAKYKSENKWLVQIEVRPHSHDFQIRSAMRQGVGTLELAGAQLLLFATSWGDGVFPVYLDLDDAERPVQVRIQLAAPATV